MKFSRNILFLFFLITPFLNVQAEEETPAEGTVRFESVAGKVLVQSRGGMTRDIQKGDEAYSGETIEVGTQSQSQIMLADGSTLDLYANARMTLAKLKQTNGMKNFFFKLGLGKVFATVTKLMNSNSSFEIEAGGVVCGVRGTEFSMDYNPANHKVDLNVLQGVVAATMGGFVQTYGAGQQGTFVNGHAQGNSNNAGSSSKPGAKGNSGNGTTGSGGSGSTGTSGSSSNGSNSTGSSGSNSSSSNGSGSSNNGGSASGGSNTSGSNGSSETGGPSTGGSSGSSSASSGNPAPGDTSGSSTGGSTGGDTNGTSGGGTNGGNSSNTTQNTSGTVPAPSNPPPALDPGAALGDLNNQFTTGVLVNGDNNLNTAQQTLTIHLVVPGGEAIP